MKKFENNGNVIYHGNAIEILKNEIADKSINLIFVDPPYNIGKIFNGNKEEWENEEAYLEWCYEWLDLCIDKLKDNGSIYVMNATQNIPFIDIYLRKRLSILSRIVWHYDSSGVQAKNYFGSLYEPIIHAVKNQKDYVFNYEEVMIEANTGAKRKLIDYRGKEPKPYNTKKVPGNTWYFPRVRYRMEEYEEHPSQKPEILLERIIKASSNKGDIILDPFSGTFTTSAVAKRLGRKSIGIEIEEEYIKTGLRRLSIIEEYKGEKLKPLSKNTLIKNKRIKDREDNLQLKMNI
ncbi:adenine-specific DNA-methyltransferase [Aliarcobacter butzleri]|uniref:adenine-specific DNA-methyltransferase n=1 Tax=Aliarcobacter butzleri TaxID=28197 RepID=UPI0019D50E48|nr:adenine-specific DNA-methyltransferase [Aliarcobacter butzleri]